MDMTRARPPHPRHLDPGKRATKQRHSVKRTAYACCPRPLRPYWDRLETSPLGSRLARGAFWSLTGTAIAQGLTLLASMLVARILGKEDYGQLGIIRSTVGMFGGFAGLGLGLTATKHVAEFRQRDPQRAGRIMALAAVVAAGTGLVATIALALLAPWLAEHTLAAPSLAGPLCVGSLMLLLGAMNGAQTGALAGFEAFKTVAQVNLAVGLVSFPMLLVGASCGGLRGTVWALVLNLSLAWTLNHLALRREAAWSQVPFRLAGCMQEWGVLWSYSLPAALSGLLVPPTIWICGAMLVRQPGGYGEMGGFSAADQWRMAILFLPGVLGQITLPVLSDLHAKKAGGSYLTALRYNTVLGGALSLAVAVPLAVASPFVMASYGPEFRECSWTLVWLALSAVFAASTIAPAQAIASQGRMWWGFLLNLVWALSLLTGARFLTGRGAAGLALAMLISYSLHAVNVLLFVRFVLSKRMIAAYPRRVADALDRGNADAGPV